MQLDLVLCYQLQWGCRYLRVDRRTLVDRVWDDKAIVELWRGSPDEAKALAAIEGLVLRGRSFRFAMLDQSSLFAADLTGADLSRASLKDALLLNAWLINSQLQGANLFRAQLQGAYLLNAKLQGTNLNLANLKGANLASAQLQDAVLAGAQLQGASFRGAWLQCADLGGAKLRGADLKSARLKGADLRSAQLQGADLREAQLFGAIFGANEPSVSIIWPKTDLDLSDLRNADFTKVLDPEDRKQFGATIEFFPDKSRAKGCLQRLDQLSGDPSHSSAPYSDSTNGDRALLGSPTSSYTSSLAKLLADELAAADSAIAGGVALRIYQNLEEGASDLYKPIDCRLIANVRADKVKLDPQMISLLLTELQQRQIKCETNQTASPD